MRTKERSQAVETTSIYRSMVDDMVRAKTSSPMTAEQMIKLKATARKRLEDMSGGRITKGHFFRGV